MEHLSERITYDDITDWKPYRPVIISAGTGAGKSYFIKNNLYDYCAEREDKILLLLHRTATIEQFNAELNAEGKSGTINIRSYQSLQQCQLYGRSDDLRYYQYIICDEFHYFVSDAAYNNATDLALKQIMEQTHAIKIFMSATDTDIRQYLSDYYKCEYQEYRYPRNFDFIGELKFYYSDQCLPEIAREIITANEKAIFFLHSARDAYNFYKTVKPNALFNCSRDNRLHRFVDESAVNKMLTERKFDASILVTTACMDSGLDIIDPLVRTILVDLPDVESLVQAIGRKRVQPDEKPITVVIRAYNNRQLGGQLTRIKKDLEMADYLKTHTTSEFVEHYPRQLDLSRITYDIPVKEGDTEYKRINPLMYRKKRNDMKRIYQMLKMGKHGYCHYIARLLEKYYEDYGYHYSLLTEDYGLHHYLKSLVGEVLLTKPDRKRLIETLNVRSNGKQLKGLGSLNKAMEELKLPYTIEQFETSRIIDGRKHKYKSAWRVIPISLAS